MIFLITIFWRVSSHALMHLCLFCLPVTELEQKRLVKTPFDFSEGDIIWLNQITMHECRLFRLSPIETVRILRILETLVSGVGLQPFDAAAPTWRWHCPVLPIPLLLLIKIPDMIFIKTTQLSVYMLLLVVVPIATVLQRALSWSSRMFVQIVFKLSYQCSLALNASFL